MLDELLELPALRDLAGYDGSYAAQAAAKRATSELTGRFVGGRGQRHPGPVRRRPAGPLPGRAGGAGPGAGRVRAAEGDRAPLRDAPGRRRGAAGAAAARLLTELVEALLERGEPALSPVLRRGLAAGRRRRRAAAGGDRPGRPADRLLGRRLARPAGASGPSALGRGPGQPPRLELHGRPDPRRGHRRGPREVCRSTTSSASTSSCATPAAATSRASARSTTRSRRRCRCRRPAACSTASAAAPAATSSGSSSGSSTCPSPRRWSAWPPGPASSCATPRAAPAGTGRPGQRARLVEAHALAAAFYAEQLRHARGAPAREFLAERGFDEAAATRFGCGFAPGGWDALTKHLLGRGLQRRPS